MHQLGADYLANPFSPQVREVLLAIDPEASKRFPQRASLGLNPAAARNVGSPSRAVAVAARCRWTKKAEAALPAKSAAAESKAPEAETAASKPLKARKRPKARRPNWNRRRQEAGWSQQGG